MRKPASDLKPGDVILTTSIFSMAMVESLILHTFVHRPTGRVRLELDSDLKTLAAIVYDRGTYVEVLRHDEPWNYQYTPTTDHEVWECSVDDLDLDV